MGYPTPIMYLNLYIANNIQYARSTLVSPVRLGRSCLARLLKSARVITITCEYLPICVMNVHSNNHEQMFHMTVIVYINIFS